MSASYVRNCSTLPTTIRNTSEENMATTDMTTPPPTARLDPKKMAKSPATNIPPPEASLSPSPAKRFKPAKEMNQSTTPVYIMAEWDSILRGDLMLSDEERNVISPITLDKPVQVRRNDFQTTSREIQASTLVMDTYSKAPSVGTQIVSTGSDIANQTTLKPIEKPATCHATTQNCISTTSEVSTQANFFNGGWLSRKLMDAIRAISPMINFNQNSLNITDVAIIEPMIPEEIQHQPSTDLQARRRGPRRVTPSASFTNINE